MRLPIAASLISALCWPNLVRADNLAYIRASTQLQRSADPSKFHPINLLDDDPATAWCEGADGLGEDEEVRIFFKKPQKIDRVVVGPSPIAGRLIQQVRVSDGMNSVTVNFGDRGDQYVEQPVRPPMFGDKYTVTIELVGGPNKSGKLQDDVACLADVMLYLKKRPFGGKTKPSEFRYDKRSDRLLGMWNGDPLGAPEKFITFAIDGTWRWTYEPLMGGKRQKLSGEYRFRGNRLLMRKGETGRWADVRFKHEAIKVDPDDIGAPSGNYEKISINQAVAKQIAGDYNNAEF